MILKIIIRQTKMFLHDCRMMIVMKGKLDILKLIINP